MKSRAGEFNAVRETNAEAVVAHLNRGPLKRRNTRSNSGTAMHFITGGGLPESMLSALTNRVKHFDGRHIAQSRFPEDSKAPILQYSPDEEIVFFFIKPVEYIYDETIKVTVLRGTEAGSVYGQSCTVEKRDGEWLVQFPNLVF